jgi:hypothetical protein
MEKALRLNRTEVIHWLCIEKNAHILMPDKWFDIIRGALKVADKELISLLIDMRSWTDEEAEQMFLTLSSSTPKGNAQLYSEIDEILCRKLSNKDRLYQSF